MSKHQPKQNDSSNPIVDIKQLAATAELAALRKSVSKMEKDNTALGETIDLLTKKLDEKDAEIRHLQAILSGAVPNLVQLDTNLISPLSDEETIALQQLKFLKTKASNGELTLEEIKKYDLLVKNKRLAQGNPTDINADYKKLPENPRDLMLIATSTPKKSDAE